MTPRFEEILRRTNFVRFVPEATYAQLRDLFQEERHEFGEVIIQQGDEADAFFILVTGRARVIKEATNGEELPLNHLVPGDEFGETALLESCVRKATVRCSTAVEVLRLERNDFLPLMKEFPELRRSLEAMSASRASQDFLYEFSNFGRLPASGLRALIQCLETARFAKGQTIIREGAPVGPMFIVREGRVRAFSGPAAQPRNLAFYRAGDWFGELSILTGASRAATVEAVTDCDLLALSPAAVDELRGQFPEFSRLLEERRAQYAYQSEVRVPLDFSQELLPVETEVADKTANAEEPDEDEEEPFAQGKFFRKRPGRRRTFPFVRQIDEMDCGAASLAMVCRHFGRRINLARIRALCFNASDGTSLQSLCSAATELGLAARALKISFCHLPKMPLPAIVHWEGNHWLVAFDVGEKFVRVADPARGLRKIQRAEFEQKWSGYAALFDYTEAFEKAPGAKSPTAWLWPFFGPFKAVLFQALGLAGLASALQLLFPIFVQVVVDQVIVAQDFSLLNLILLAMAVSLVFLVLSNVIQEYLLSFLSVRVDSTMLDFITRRLLALPMSYFNSRRTGDIQRRLDGARQVRQFFVQHGLAGMLAGIQFAGCLAIMAMYSLYLLGIFALALPLYAVLAIFSRRVLRPLLADLEESHGKYNSHQIDAIKGIETVKAAAAELAFRNQLLNTFLGVSRKLLHANFVMMLYENMIQTVSLLALILFLWAGSRIVMEGQLTIGAFVGFSSLIAMASAALLRGLSVWDEFQLVSVLLDRLADVMEQEPEQGKARERLKPVRSLAGHIELRNLGFSYGGKESPPILQGISTEIPPGKTVALVGRSGSGKTTLVKILAGLVEPTEGSIYYDQEELKTLNYRELRRQIGLVLQENHLFDDTIANNIAFGDTDVDYERIFRAAQLANAHDFISRLPLGYETRVGESGLAVSGGQKQRIAIARALYHNPPVLIFDEATSALDTESERAIQSNLLQLKAGRTCIVIAHRLSTVRDADLILVLEQGKIAEAGTHDELMTRRGLYFYLSSQQMNL